MKTHPILFSTPMVRSILEKRKVQTRRVIKCKSTLGCISVGIMDGIENLCPYGKVGDILWVRESSCYIILDHAHDLLEGQRDRNQRVYKASMHEDFMAYAKEKYGYKWKPSIHMTKEACRIFLEITAIRVERLNDISDSDAIAEGIASDTCKDHLYNKTLTLYKDYLSNNMKLLPASVSFKTLWQSINGMNSWASNPWVWVIEFKRIGKPENF